MKKIRYPYTVSVLQAGIIAGLAAEYTESPLLIGLSIMFGVISFIALLCIVFKEIAES